jgi:hypothetical protein
MNWALQAFFFRNGEALDSELKRCIQDFFIKINQQESVKNIHHKIRSQHSAPKNQIIDEVNCRQGLYLKKRNNTPPANYQGHPLSHPTAKTWPHIQCSRPLTSVLCLSLQKPSPTSVRCSTFKIEIRITLIRTVVDTTMEDLSCVASAEQVWLSTAPIRQAWLDVSSFSTSDDLIKIMT